MTYRVLSIDGGGVRGVLVAVLLQRLVNESKRPNFLQQIDLLAGTSTGGLLALGLAAGISLEEVRQLYEEQSALIFSRSFGRRLKNLGFATGAKYANQNLKQALSQQFGQQRLADLSHRVLVSSFDLDCEENGQSSRRSWKPKFFHNYPGPGSDGDERVVDVAMRTAAAPAFFPTYQTYIDGGVVANHPAVCALAQALDVGTGGQQIEDVALLSLGTGHNPKFLPVRDANWGWLQWAVNSRPFAPKTTDLPLLEVLLDGMDGVANYQCQRLLGNRYHRVQPTLPQPIDLDDAEKVPLLVDVAMSVDLKETVEWIEQHF